MNINFNNIPTQTLSALHGGEGDVVTRIFESENVKVMPFRLQPGASIGMHSHRGTEVIYVLYGAGKVICGGVEEELAIDVCHICPAGAEHSIVNTGGVELVALLTEYIN